MKGEKTVVEKQIKSKESKALPTHWFIYSLNLAVDDAIKANTVKKNSLESTFEIIKLIRELPKQDGTLRYQNHHWRKGSK